MVVVAVVAVVAEAVVVVLVAVVGMAVTLVIPAAGDGPIAHIIHTHIAHITLIPTNITLDN